MVKTIDQLSQFSNTKINSVGLISSAGTVYGCSEEEKTIKSNLEPKSVYGLYHCLEKIITVFMCAGRE